MSLPATIFECFVIVMIIILLFYYYSIATFKYWENRKIPYLKPLPFIGNSLYIFKGNEHSSIVHLKAYNSFDKEKYFGKYSFRIPVLVLRDPSLIATVLISDFSHFYNRPVTVDPKLDCLSFHLVNLRDHQWKNLRNKLNPVFSTSKLKSMYQSVVHCCDSLNKVLSVYSWSGENVNAKILMANFTLEVIGHCAFGINMNSLRNPDSDFRKMAKLLFRPSLLGRIRLIIRFAYPKLLKWLRWKAVPQFMENYFINMIKETVAAREENGVEAVDYLQLLINLRNEDNLIFSRHEGEKVRMSESDNLFMNNTLMTSSAAVFFFAGYDTIASTLSFCLLELAKNPPIQERLRDEILNRVVDGQGIPSFEAIKSMEFLEQIVLETLRMYPPIGNILRECVKDWRIPGTDVTISKGTLVQVPVYALHHDPQYFHEPELFDPDRFGAERKENIRKGTFLPYGDGPRICFGKKFAELEMKMALSSMLLKYRFSVDEETSSSIKFNPRSLFLMPLNGPWLKVELLNL